MKNCPFPNTTYRTLNIFAKTYAKVKGKVVETRQTCIYEYFSWNRRIGFMSKPLAIYDQSYFAEKWPISLENTSGLWVFWCILELIERKICKNKASVFPRVWLTKNKRWAHGQTSRHLRLVKLSSKNCHFPYNTKDFKYLDEYLLCDGRKNGQNTGNMDVDVFLVKVRHFLHLAPYGKSLYSEKSSVSFIFCLSVWAWSRTRIRTSGRT